MHDLQRIRQDLQESLSLDKHPVALLLGAGCPFSIQVPEPSGGTRPLIPDMEGLTAIIKESLNDDPDFQTLVEQFASDGRPAFTIEELLSHVRLMRRIVGSGNARGLTAASLQELEESLCRHVTEAVNQQLPAFPTPYHELTAWIGGVPRRTPVHIFTTNYDLLLEQALERSELPFFDGFVGAQRPFFDLRAIEDEELPARWTRLWKLHGSISWKLEGDGRVTRLQYPQATESGLLIYPSELKYDQSRRMPYLAMIDRLRHFLRLPSAFLVTIGYSFADEHLNEVLIQGLRGNPTSGCFALLFKDLRAEPGARSLLGKMPHNLTIVSRNTGVLRGVEAKWIGASAEKEPTSDLGDFQKFAAFLRELCIDQVHR